MRIRIATRKSALALWQSNHVAEIIQGAGGISSIELVPLSTRGDEQLDRSLESIGGKGLFIKELEIAMQNGNADIAVHSMKDVPAELPPGFCIAAVLERANPADALVGGYFDKLPEAARVGSSSLRRRAQLLSMRPDLEVEPLRGNVETRLKKLKEGRYDAIVLACAGLERLGLASRIDETFPPERMLPAAAQGVIGIECLERRTDLLRILETLDHAATRTTTTAERAVVRRLRADCRSPVASFAQIEGPTLLLRALVASPDGRSVIRERMSGPASDPAALGAALADRMLELGAGELLGRAGAAE